MGKGSQRPGDGANKAYADILRSLSGKEFTADLGYSWTCSASRVIYELAKDAAGKPDPSQPPVKSPSGQVGCGKQYYQADRTKKPEQQIARQANGEYPYEISCTCGAVIRAFANLDNLRA